MKILFCIAGLPVGGAERQLLRLMRGLHAKGHEIRLHVFGNHEAVHYKEVYDVPFPVFFSGIKRGVRFRAAWIILRDLRRILKEFHPDILFGTLHKANVAVRLAKLLGFTRAPVAVTMRTDFARLYPGPRKALERILAPLTDAWVSNHKPSAELFSRHIGSRAVYIPNGIDEEDLAESSTGETFPAFRGLRILSVGSLYVPYKNQVEMLNAIHLVRQRRPELALRYRIVGSGAHRDLLQARIDTLGLGGVAELVPAVRNVTDYYRDADVLLHGSIIEGCPNVMLEAMLCGVPSIGSSYVGRLGVVEDGVSGVVAAGDDGESMAEAILRFADLSASERQAMGKAARERILHAFSNDVMVLAHEVLFEKMLARSL